MPRRSKPIINFHHKRFMQISESHCGPAVIQMLLSSLDIDVSQEAVAEAGGATSLIELNGMRVDQMAMAVHQLAPQVTFFFKEHATIGELVRVVNDYHYPVGVEWQGLFEDEDEEDDEEDNEEEEESSQETVLSGEIPAGPLPDSETEDNDYGHYSLVVRADRRKRQLIIADPYKDYFSQARIFPFDAFEARWYDFNEVTDPISGQQLLVEDYHMMFVIARRGVLFPQRLGMRTFNW